jgi:hypothetical protein
MAPIAVSGVMPRRPWIRSLTRLTLSPVASASLFWLMPAG